MKSIIIKPSNQDQKYRRFLVYIPIDKFSPQDININAPYICPYCGSTKIAGKFKIKSSTIQTNYISVFICKDHLKYEKLIPLGLVLISLSIIVSVTAFLCLAIYVRNFQLSLISLFIVLILISIYIGGAIKYSIDRNKEIKHSILFEAFREGFVISSTQAEWAEEFKKLNMCLELKEDTEKELRLFDEVKSKYNKILKVLGFISIITFIMNFIIINIEVLFTILEVVFVLTFLSWGIIFMYEMFFIIQKRKSEIYFKKIE